MRKKQRVSRVLSILMATVIITPTMTSLANSYKDVQEHWAKSHINRLSSEGILKGYGDGIFAPDKHITREETAAIVDRTIKNRNTDIKDKNKQLKLSDIEGRWSSESVKNLISKGIISGYPDGTFKPEGNITRQEAVKIIEGILNPKAIGNKTKKFTDIENQWGKEFIDRLSLLGLIDGYGDGTFKPNNYITRAELSKIISVIIEREKELLIKKENEILDKSELKLAIEKAEKVNTSDKTKETVDKLNEILELSKKIYENGNATVEEISDAVKRLNKAIAGLKTKASSTPSTKPNSAPVITASDVSLTIGEVVNLLNNVVANDLEDGDLTAYIKVVGEVPTKDGKASEIGTYEIKYTVQDSKGKKAEKIVQFTVTSNDKTGLKSTIENAKKVDTSDKTKETVEILNRSIEASEKVYENADSTKIEIMEAIKNLNDAINGLKVNESPVITATDKTITIGDKVEILDGVSASDAEDGDLTAEIKVIGEVSKAEDGTADKVGNYEIKYSVKDSHGKESTAEIIYTVSEADKTELNLIIEKAENLDKKNLTDDSVESINKELENAKKIKDDVNSLPSVIRSAIEKLNNTVDNAEEIVQDGTIENPYRLSTVEDLKNLKESGANENTHYILINDIDMKDSDWKPFNFDGNIDGKDFKIQNLRVNNTHSKDNDLKEVGLFSNYGTSKSEIQNLILENIDISNSSEEGVVLSTGGIAGKSKGKIRNCTVKGVIKGGVAGGITGYSYNELRNCGFIGVIMGDSNTGGISGYANAGIYESYAKGLISSSKTYVGGIAGSAINIRNCYSSTLLKGRYIGGIAGTIETEVASSYSSAQIGSSYDKKGGIYASGSGGFVSIRDVYFDGDLFQASSNDAKYERTTEEMKKGLSNNDIYKGWKEDIWDIAEGRYPKLKWEEIDLQSDNKLIDILITESINKKDYYVGEELDLHGLKVVGVYGNGDVEEINISSDNISGFDSSKAADSQTVSIKVDDKTTSFEVKVWSKDIGLEGEGSKESPYKISTGEEMKNINKLIDTIGIYFELTNNIDMKDIEWKPIQFNGHFDGKGYTISNFNVSGNDQLIGLFTKIGSKDILDTSFINTNFENSSVKNAYTGNVGYYNDTRNNTGTLAGESWGTISNIHILNGKVENAKEHIGGIVGDNRGEIKKSSFTGTLSESLSNVVEMGGITSRNFGTISESYTSGNIIRDTNIFPICSIGGISGKSENDSKILNSYSVMNISGRSGVGGITGGAGAKTEIVNSYYAGKINSGATYDSARGGIYAGWTKPVVKDSYYDKDIAGFTKTSDAGMEKTTQEMKTGNPFKNWDTNIWRFTESKYPELFYQ